MILKPAAMAAPAAPTLRPRSNRPSSAHHAAWRCPGMADRRAARRPRRRLAFFLIAFRRQMERSTSSDRRPISRSAGGIALSRGRSRFERGKARGPCGATPGARFADTREDWARAWRGGPSSARLAALPMPPLASHTGEAPFGRATLGKASAQTWAAPYRRRGRSSKAHIVDAPRAPASLPTFTLATPVHRSSLIPLVWPVPGTRQVFHISADYPHLKAAAAGHGVKASRSIGALAWRAALGSVMPP